MALASAEPSGLFSSPKKRNLVVCLLLVVATLAVYNSVNQHPFVNYDDDRYIVENPHVRAGLTVETLKWAFISTEQANWHPVTWLSHALDCQLFRLNAAGHHLTSLMIHAVNAALLFLLLVYATGRVGPSAFVAALFALHPINVESVAWIAERKNVLSTFFMLLAIAAYGRYAQKPSWQRYSAVVALFALGLMSKPMVITLPCVLLLLDFWPLARVKGSALAHLVLPQKPLSFLLLEKLPLLAMSAASAIITIQAQQSAGAMRSTMQFSFAVRLENALVAYASYFWKMLCPAKLAPLYPHPGDSLAFWQIALSLVVLAGITSIAIALRSHRYLLVGWLWFLGALVPVIGLVQVGDQAMADRYAYIPLVGIFMMIAFATADFFTARKLQPAIPLAISAIVLAALGFATYRQVTYWSSSYELWSHTLAVTSNNFIAENNLGGALLLQGKVDDAFPHFQAAARINPNDPMSRSNIGAYLQEHNQLQAAIEQYQTTIRLAREPLLLAATYANLGTAYRDLGDGTRAEESYNQALQLNPAQSSAYLGLGRLREQQGRRDDAIRNYERAVALRPSEEAYLWMARALEQAGKLREALEANENVLKINPDSNDAQAAADRIKRMLERPNHF
jgi:tetratricopeptide (TPR) repeat protein